MKYLAGKNKKVNLFIRKNRTLAKYKENNLFYQNAPDAGGDRKALSDAAIDIPSVMLIHNDGTAEGWGGSQFWWPVMMTPKNVPTTIFSSETPKGRIVKRKKAENNRSKAKD